LLIMNCLNSRSSCKKKRLRCCRAFRWVFNKCSVRAIGIQQNPVLSWKNIWVFINQKEGQGNIYYYYYYYDYYCNWVVTRWQ
jgi:hypothetical protein